jgi:CHAT domain-containing protein/Tfp pilus assembly protein PilF
MTQQNKLRPALELRRRRDAYQTLAGLLTLSLFFSLAPAVSSHQAFGGSLGRFQQSAQEPHNPGSGTGENDVRTLEPGLTHRREMAGGQRHTYRIRLAADQFFKAIIEQHGIDVVARLLGPDGKEIIWFDSESRLRGQESVWQVAEAEGEYRLVVEPKLKEAAAAYEIRIEELRAATENDRALQEARNMYRKADVMYEAGKYDEAFSSYERALGIREKALGLDHSDVANAINGLALCYTSKGEYSKAEPLFQRSLDIREKTLGPEHPDVAISLGNLGLLHYHRGEYAKAEPLFQRSLTIKEKEFGPEHLEVASALNNLAILSRGRGDYEKAEPLYLRALAIREKGYGPEHLNITPSLNNVALLYYYKGEYSKAEPFSQRALSIREKTLGPEHPNVANSLNSLALIYHQRGEYSKAEPLYLRALDIREKKLGLESVNVAGSLINLALLYHDRGDYEKAEPLYLRALSIMEKSMGPESINVARALNNLGLLYTDRHEYSKAEPLYLRALDIKEKALGPEHHDLARSLNNLGLLYYHRGDCLKAESLHLRALAIFEKAFGPEHPDVAGSLDNLAVLSRVRGDYEKAESLHQRALAIHEKSLGPESPAVASSLDSLAELYMAKNDIARAVTLKSRANAISERNLKLNLATFSERQMMAYLATLAKQTDQTLTLHLHYAPHDPVARNLAATMILQRKGRALDATSISLNALRSRFNEEDRTLLDQLTDARSRVASLSLDGPQEMSAEQYRDRIKYLLDQAEKFEAEISRRSGEFRARSLPITLEAVQAAIPNDAALIEFASYRPFNPGAAKDDEAYGGPRYVAYVLRGQGEIQWKELGEAKAIGNAIARLREALRDPKRQDVKNLARIVDQKVFQPLRPLLGNMTRLLVSPEGELNLIPFAALVDERMRYVVERYSISSLASGRDLLRLQVPRQSKDGPLVVAAPNFGKRSQVEASRSEKHKKDQPKREIGRESARSALKEFYFPPLPYAEREGEALRALLPGATLLTKGQATKAALSKIHSPRLLHIATHGFFLEDQDKHSLLRSGLALAGANEHKDDDNGILTALEVTGLNLWGTKLVVLSACDTGVGEVKTGDGVHGLRRALALAGTETQVMSLWAVSDKATRELMVAYYGRLNQGQGRGEALRRVQLEMLKKVNRRHPYYWASFIQSGEWANLEGKR